MADRDTVEQNRIKKKISKKKEASRKARRKRNIRLAVFCAIFSIIVIIGAMYIILNCISDKEKLRKEGIKAFNSGSYNEAINDFKESLDQEEWFTGNMDDDTRLYLAACYMRTDDYASAKELYSYLTSSTLTKVNKTKVQQLYDLAFALESVNDRTATEEELKKLISEYERGNTSVALYIGTCYQLMGDYDKMVSYYTEYTDTYKMNTYIAYQISNYYLDKDMLNDARGVISQGLSCGDDLFIDKVLYNDAVVSEKELDYQTAYEKISALVNSYPNNETYQKEFAFLDSRINYNTEPVHTRTDADSN